MTAKKAAIDWTSIEQLVRRSFTGQRLTEEEQAAVLDAFQRAPGEYKKRSEAVRESERARLRW